MEEQEMENVIVEDCGYPTQSRSKDLRGKASPKYTGKDELPDQLQEQYIHRIIYHMGNRKKAYEEVWYPDVENPKYPARAPYRFFERKGFMLRYNYLTTQAVNNAGLDKNSLLLKASQLIDKSVKSNKVRDFTALVDTILKLKADPSKVYDAQPKYKQLAPTAEDLAPVRELLEGLNG